EHHRQSARHHDRPAAPDFRGNARSLPRIEDHCRAWRRLSRLLRRARRPCMLRVTAKLQSEHHAEEKAVRISQPALFRRHGVHTGRPAPSGGTGRRQPGVAGHRPPDPLGAAPGRPCLRHHDTFGQAEDRYPGWECSEVIWDEVGLDREPTHKISKTTPCKVEYLPFGCREASQQLSIDCEKRMRAVETPNWDLMGYDIPVPLARKPGVEVKGGWLDLEGGFTPFGEIKIDGMVRGRADRGRHTRKHRQCRAMDMPCCDQLHAGMTAHDGCEIARVEEILAVHVPDARLEWGMV